MSWRRGRFRALAALSVLVVTASCTSSSNKANSSTTTGAAPTSTGPSSTTAPGPTATTNPALPPVAPVSWTVCNGNNGPSGDDCATLQVPLNYDDPGGSKIGLALDRHKATGTKIGSLLINPGGPGASGVDALDYVVSMLPDSVLSRFDVVGFDPRGVDRSAPIRCLTGPQLDAWIHLNPAPTTAAGFQQLVNSSETLVKGCQAHSGAELPYVGTVNAARDMDEIRAAVGDPKLNYLGFSYGTFLGAEYASLFPTHIRAMVLDGALDPALDPVTSVIDQAVSFDKNLQDFLANCSSSSICAWHPGGDLRTAFNALLARIAAHPLTVRGSRRTVGPGEAFYGIVVNLYDMAAWPQLANALAAAERGDGTQLLESSDNYTGRMPNGAYSNELESNNAVSCIDGPWPSTPAELMADGIEAAAMAPEFGRADLYGGIPCTIWPDQPSTHPMAINAGGSPPIVVVGSTGDPATPYADAQALARELQHGVLLTRVGDGHTGYPFSQCVRDHVDAYLLNLTVPAPGTQCQTP